MEKGANKYVSQIAQTINKPNTPTLKQFPPYKKPEFKKPS